MADEEFVDGTIRLRLDLRAYRLSAIKKAAYRLADRFSVVLDEVETESVRVTVSFRVGTSEQAARESVRAYHQELLDQELREQVADETSSIRTLIMAQAFSRTNLVGSDE